MANELTLTLKSIVVSGSQEYAEFPSLQSDGVTAISRVRSCNYAKSGVVRTETGGKTVDLADFTSIVQVVIENCDLTNFLSVQFKNAAAATVVLKLLAGDVLILPDVDPTVNMTLTSDSADGKARILVAGNKT